MHLIMNTSTYNIYSWRCVCVCVINDMGNGQNYELQRIFVPFPFESALINLRSAFPILESPWASIYCLRKYLKIQIVARFRLFSYHELLRKTTFLSRKIAYFMDYEHLWYCFENYMFPFELASLYGNGFDEIYVRSNI